MDLYQNHFNYKEALYKHAHYPHHFIEPLAASFRKCDLTSGTQSKSHHLKSICMLMKFCYTLQSPRPHFHQSIIWSVIIVSCLATPSTGQDSAYNQTQLMNATAGCPFKWTAESITYLGIHISPNLNKLFKLNYTPLLQQIKDICKDRINYHYL